MNPLTCPHCNFPLPDNAYFCPNCGKKIKDQPTSTSIGNQIRIYLISFLLPPFGLLPGIRYLLQEDPKAKLVGGVAIALTVVSLIIGILTFNSVLSSVNQAVNQQVGPLQNMGY